MCSDHAYKSSNSDIHVVSFVDMCETNSVPNATAEEMSELLEKLLYFRL